MIKVFNGTEWIEKEPTHGDSCRNYDEGGGFVEYHHAVMPKEDEERLWRDGELAVTDDMPERLSDHPSHQRWLDYRQELRDYPNQTDFPNEKRPEY